MSKKIVALMPMKGNSERVPNKNIKDVNALLSFSKKHDIELNTISGGWKTNLKVRQEKDWEEKEGRSVSFKKTK